MEKIKNPERWDPRHLLRGCLGVSVVRVRALSQTVHPLSVWDEWKVTEFLGGGGEEGGPRDGVRVREVQDRA